MGTQSYQVAIQYKSTRQLSQPWRKLLLATHLIVGVGLIGAAAVLVTLGTAGLNDADPSTVYPAMNRVAVTVVIPLASLALLTGIVQAAVSGWGLIRYWWVTLKLVFTASVVILTSIGLRPKTANAADTANAGGTIAQADQLDLVLFPAIAATVLVTNVLLGIFKPPARLAGGG